MTKREKYLYKIPFYDNYYYFSEIILLYKKIS